MIDSCGALCRDRCRAPGIDVILVVSVLILDILDKIAILNSFSGRAAVLLLVLLKDTFAPEERHISDISYLKRMYAIATWLSSISHRVSYQARSQPEIWVYISDYLSQELRHVCLYSLDEQERQVWISCTISSTIRTTTSIRRRRNNNLHQLYPLAHASSTCLLVPSQKTTHHQICS